MYDLTKSYFADIKERAVAAGATISEEGTCLIYVSDGAGGHAVQPSTGGASDYAGTADRTKVAGFAITDALKILTEVVQETFNIPSSSPYTVQLKHSNVIVAERYVTIDGSAAAYNAGAPAATEFNVASGGLMTFNSADAGKAVVVTYRYTLTASEVLDKFHDRSVNNKAQDYFSTVSVGCDSGELFTSMFDASQAYVVDAAIYSGASGKLTSASGGAYVGICCKLPSTTDAMLGVKFGKTA